MSVTPFALNDVRRFTVTVGPGVLTDEQAARVEAAIQKTVADQLADFDLADRCTVVDPIRELAKEPQKKGFDWRDILISPTAGLIATPLFSVSNLLQAPSAPATESDRSKSFFDAIGEAVRQALSGPSN